MKYTLREYKIKPSKKLGQNFLADKNIQNKIIENIPLTKEDTVLEIGPGLGAITEGLCRKTKKVIAVEKDTRLYTILLKKFSTYCNNYNLELINSDILKYRFDNKQKIKVVGNLPYNISSPILGYLIEHRSFIGSIYVTLQKEFAERLVALPGTKVYGSISCFAQFYTEPKILFAIKKSSFYPIPKVDSCFLRLVVRKHGLYLTDEEKLFKIIRSCFGQRRKVIVNSLYSTGFFQSKQETQEKIEKAGIGHSQRPEVLSLKQFAELANII